MTSPRYYPTTVGQDHIPDPWAWLDRAIPLALIAVGFAIDVAVLVSFAWMPA